MKKSKAFSLFEISIVTIIIAILMAGVLQSRNIVKKAKINNARSLTISSPVKEIGDLVLWYEATLEKSFSKDDAFDGNSIGTWYDINPNVATTSNNATQSTSNNKPTYKESAINGIPAVRFSRSSNNYLSFSATALASESYTIFVVEQRRANYSDNYFIGGGVASSNQNLIIGYKQDTTMTLAMINNGVDATINAYNATKPSIHSFVFNFTNKKYYLNGSSQTLVNSGSSADETQSISSFSQSYLGYNAPTSSYYEGDIGEIIIFRKALKTEERKAIESYLGKKWNIALL